MTAKTETLSRKPTATKAFYRTVKIDGLDIFYREAGPKDAPVVSCSTASRPGTLFRNLIPALTDEFHLVAPDYPGYGNSSMPTVDEFEYTFDHLAEVIEKFTEKVGLKKYTMYVMDYGVRLATAWPSSIPTASRPSWCRTATPTTRGSTAISGTRSRLTGRKRPRRARSLCAASDP